MINYEFLAHLCCFTAILVWNMSIQNKEKEKILYFQFLSNMLYGMSYFLLKIPIAAIMDTLGGLRCFVFFYKTKKHQDISLSWLFIFCILIIILGIINYNGIISLIPILISVFYAISSWSKDATWIRIIFLLAAFLWVYYNIVVGAYVAVLGNILEIISGIVSLYRFNKPKNKLERT